MERKVGKELMVAVLMLAACVVSGSRSKHTQRSIGDVPKPSSQAADEVQLVHRLKRLYSPSVRPVVDHNDTVIVDIAMSLHGIYNVDEELGVAELEVWVMEKWIDHVVGWDPAQYNGVSKIFVEAHLLWHPKLVIAHSGHSDQMVSKSLEAKVTHDGVVMLQVPLKVKAVCDVNLSHFPFDSLHACTIILDSPRYTTDEVTLRFANNVRTMDMSPLRCARKWMAHSVPGSVSKITNEWGQSDHQQVTFRLELQRRGKAQELGIYVAPMVVLALLVPALFILPNSSKIVLGVGLLISWTVLLNQLTQVLPSPTGRIPIVEQYYLGVFVLLCMAILLSSVTINMAHEVHTRPPYLLTKVMRSVFKCVRWVTCLRRFTPDDATSPVSTQYDTTDLSSNNGRPLADASSYSSLNMLQKLDGDGDGLQGVTPMRPSPQVQWAFIASTLDRVGFVMFLGGVFLLPLALVVAVYGGELRGTEYANNRFPRMFSSRQPS